VNGAIEYVFARSENGNQFSTENRNRFNKVGRKRVCRSVLLHTVTREYCNIRTLMAKTAGGRRFGGILGETIVIAAP